MAGPRDFFKKAENRRRMEPGKSPAVPAPVPVQMPPTENCNTGDQNSSLPAARIDRISSGLPMECRIAPQPIGGHSIYRELMRSHDRMGTRHIPRQK